MQRFLKEELELQENPDQKQEELATVRVKLNILRKDPILTGISPLYKDYKPERWWFEIPKFVSTLILCGVATLVPAEGASQVFIALVTSTAMLVLYANYHPYVSTNDDVLAQVCQFSLTFTISVGLLHMASESFKVIVYRILGIAAVHYTISHYDTDRFSKLSAIKDYLFGYLLILCNLSSIIVGFGVISFEFCATAFPTKTEKITEFVKEKLGTSRRVLASIHPRATIQSKPRTRVAPVSNIVHEGPENPSEETRIAVGVLSVDNEEDLAEQTPTSLFPAMNSPTAGSVVPCPSDSSISGPSGSGMIDPSSTRSRTSALFLSFHLFLYPSFN